MTSLALNEQFLPDGTCFGCGVANPEGLQIRLFRDGDATDRIVGRFQPRPTLSGFPGITHGGVQFTALDCVAGWCVLALRLTGEAMPLTRSATMRFRKPARVGDTFTLRGRITADPATPKDPIVIRAELLDGNGDVLTEADYEYVIVPADRFRSLVGIDALPETYLRHFATTHGRRLVPELAR